MTNNTNLQQFDTFIDRIEIQQCASFDIRFEQEQREDEFTQGKYTLYDRSCLIT